MGKGRVCVDAWRLQPTGAVHVSMHQTANWLLLELAAKCLHLEVCNCGSCSTHAQHHVMLVTHHQCPMQLVAHDQEVTLGGLVGVKEIKQLTV